MTIEERLAQLQYGFAIIQEADDDTYQLGDETDDSNDNTDEPESTTPATSDNIDSDSTEPNAPSDPTDDPLATTDDQSSIDEPVPPQQPDRSKGEFITLSAGSRAMLQYKNYGLYTELFNQVQRMINEITELETSSTSIRDVISKSLIMASQLKDKLNNYIIYIYQNNSYEVNFTNYMNFVVEKKLIEEILQQIHNQTYDRQ